MFLSLCVGSLFGPCFVMHYLVLSSFAIILTRKRELVALLCLPDVALPHIAMGWSAVCYCGISLSYLQ